MTYYQNRPDGSAIHVPDGAPPKKERPALLPVVIVAVVLLGTAALFVAPRFLDDDIEAGPAAGTPAEQIASIMIEQAANGDVITTAMGPGSTEEEALDNAFIRATMAGIEGDPSTQTVAQIVLPTSQRVTSLYPEARFIAIVVFLNTVEDEAAEGT